MIGVVAYTFSASPLKPDLNLLGYIPRRLGHIELSDRLNKRHPMQLCIQAIQQDPTSMQMLEERYVGPPYDLEALLQQPTDSLGWTYAKVLSK